MHEFVSEYRTLILICVEFVQVPAGRQDCSKILEKGCSYSVFTGGVTEMVLSKNSAEVLYVKKRKGVVDLAQKLGNIPIIPVYAFGTTKHFSRWPDENESVAHRP